MSMARTVDIENVSKARRRGICRILVHSTYWKCFTCTVLICVCIFYATWCHIQHNAYAAHSVFKYHHGPCAQGYNFIPIVFGLMLYVVYMMECWHSRTKHVKLKKMQVDEANQLFKSLRGALPIIWWKSVCYHYLRRTRQVTRYRNGDAISATQVYYERVNSHTAGNVFLYDICGVRDISKIVLDLDKFSATRVKLSRGFVFACMQAANEFEEQRTRFFNENETRDDYMEVREGMDLSDVEFQDEILCFKSSRVPWFLHPISFWLFSIFLLSWPLRIFAEWRTAFLSYHVTKLFGTNYLSPSSVNYTGPLTRTSTMNSIELEGILRREQYFVVPSYSEAMLLQPANANVVLMSPYHAQTGFLCGPTTNRPITNENVVIRNYGALEELDECPSEVVDRPPPRSRSMSFYNRRREPSIRSAPVRSNRGPIRSLSIGGISGFTAWNNGYTPIGDERINERTPERNSDRVPLLPPNEPPPPYEIAMRMCAPLYDRIRRSISSRLNSISHSSSKELKNLQANGQP